jgi:hypothetical protein
MDNLGPIIGTLSALGVLFDFAKFAFQVLVGYLIFTGSFLDTIAASFGKIGDKAKLLTGKGLRPEGMQGPVMKGGAFTSAQAKAQADLFKKIGTGIKAAGIVGLVVFLVTKAVEFYEKFSDFKEMVDNTLADLGTALEELWGAFGELFDELFGQDGIGGAMEALDPIVKWLLEVLIPMLGMTFETIIDGVKLAVNIVTNIVKYFMDVLNPIIRGLAMLFSDPLQGVVLIVVGVLNIIFGFVDMIVNSIVDVLNFLIERFESTVRAIGNSPLGKMLKDLFGWDMANFKVDFKVGKIDLAGKMIQGVENYFKKRDNKAIQDSFGGDRTRADGSLKLARGGTVFPSRGGTLATIAEAGRPERVEPLDPDGLSKRDKAMIKMLAPGAGGINITVNPSPGMDEKELAAMVSRRIGFEIKRGTI